MCYQVFATYRQTYIVKLGPYVANLGQHEAKGPYVANLKPCNSILRLKKKVVTLAYTNKARGPGPHNCLLRLGNFRFQKEEEG